MPLALINNAQFLIFLPHLSCRGVWRYTLITHHMGLTQIDLIKQIYYFFCGFRDFCEKLLFLSQIAQMPQKGIWVSHRLI